MPDAMAFLRVLTLVGRLILVVGLLRLARRLPEEHARPARRAWYAVVGIYVIIGLDYTAVEFLDVLSEAVDGEAFRPIYYDAYYLSYVLNSALSALLPAVVLACLANGGPWFRRLALAAIVAVAAVWGRAMVTGAWQEWSTLLTSARPLSFIAIGGYLGFWALLFLGRMRSVDVYMASFIAVRTIFIVVLPAQEIVFQLVGRTGAVEVWHLTQVLQVAMVAVQIVIVGKFVRRLRTHRQIRHVRVAVPS